MKLVPLPPEKVIKILEHIGFRLARQKGSHIFMKHPDGRTTVVPVHKGEELSKGILRKIIRDTKLSKDEFLSILDKI